VVAGSFRRGLGVGRAAVVLAAGGLAAGAGVAATPPTGDTTAMSFFARKADAYAQLPGARIVQTGYFAVRKGTGTSVDYAWGRPTPSGYVPARAKILVRLSDGRIVAYVAELRARGVRPLRVLMAGGRVFTSTTRCWRKSSAAASPLGTGERYMFNDGGAHYRPLRRNGGRTAVTFSYPWSAGTSARETSSFGRKTPPRVAVTISLRGKQRMTIRKSITPLAKPPKLPVPGPPGKPVPKPLCRS
jgi:hypothetical protein